MDEVDNIDDQDETMDSDKDDSDNSDSGSNESDAFCSSDASVGEIGKTIDACNSESELYLLYFYSVREAYIAEKLADLDNELLAIDNEVSRDYLQPLEDLAENKNERIEIAGVLRNYRSHNAKLHFEAELAIAEQNFQNEKRLLNERFRFEIEEKIRKLNEDRHKADSDFYSDSYLSKRIRKYSTSISDEFGEKKRPKPVQVNGPHIVFMIKDEEIMEDLNYVRCYSRPYKSSYNIAY
ncbi:hypothetical protein RDWZM_009455 [Blomia tropicalis]|uniref:Uncharacterized protein n=1 Tax=Blomia tropicalis TaxID=40697 RepID=A0A9Q0M1F7_BLOTA|nr:Breast cancer metastasis-suppressor 1-like protein [Blomia tropicalis]KAJ6218298.1 hypothetical protein RDWZM_009455 [Blomia tropicalis]